MCDTHSSPVVVDVGSNTTKAGIAGDEARCVSFPTVVGRLRVKAAKEGPDKQVGPYVGQEALERRGFLTVKYPMEFGIITNWDDYDVLMHHLVHNELRVNPEEHPFLLTEADMNPKANRERAVMTMFETFNTPALYVASQAVLSLYAGGRTSGTVLDSGAGVTHTVPVYEGHALRYTVSHLDVAGRDLTDYLMKLVNQRGYSFTTTAERNMLSQVKEKLCYVALDYEQDLAISTSSRSLEESFQLPDGRVIVLGSERFQCPEALFKPPLVGMEMAGVHEFCVNTIRRANSDLHEMLYANIVLSGGSTMFPGFADRLKKDVSSLAPDGTVVNVVSPSDHSWAAWNGGSVIASMSTFLDMCITKDEYDEYGPAMVHRKCF